MAFMKWATGPTGIYTTHFWGPAANWGLVGASMYNAVAESVDKASPSLTSVLLLYSCLFARFAWMVKPRNYLLLSCHVANIGVQTYQLGRIAAHQKEKKAAEEEETAAAAKPLA